MDIISSRHRPLNFLIYSERRSEQRRQKIFISFLAAISVNLGILNLMPIPVLDGGQLLFLAYEAVMRKEPSARTQMILTSFGAAILLTMMIFAVFNDIKGF